MPKLACSLKPKSPANKSIEKKTTKKAQSKSPMSKSSVSKFKASKCVELRDGNYYCMNCTKHVCSIELRRNVSHYFTDPTRAHFECLNKKK